MNKMYFVSEFFDETMTSGNTVPEGNLFREYDEALEVFNTILAEKGKRLVKQPKGEKELSVVIDNSCLQLWVISYGDELTTTV